MSGLVLFALGFATANGICAMGISRIWIVLLMATAGGSFGLAMYFRKRLALLTAVAVILAGVFAGCGWYLVFRAVYLDTAIAVDGQTQSAVIRVSDYSYASGYGGAVDGWIELEGKHYQIRAYLDEHKALSPGDEITGLFRFRVTTPGGAEDATYHQGKGIFLLAYQEGTASYTFCREAPWWCFPSVLRMKIEAVLQSCFAKDVFPFVKALLLGDGEDLSYATDTAFKLSGIRHIIAVSGLHVSILYSMLSLITAKRRFLTALAGIPVLFLFAAVAGFTPSVVRACIMIGLMMAAIAFNREYDPPTGLAFATVVMLLINPLTITSVGFQLSAASVGGIFLFQKPISGALRGVLGNGKGILGKVGRGIASSVGVSLSATLLTAPLSAVYFGAVSLVAVITNLLTLWAVSYIFYGIIAVCGLNLIWHTGAVMLAQAASWLIRFVLTAAEWMASFPLAAVYTRSPYMAAWLIFIYILLVVYLLSPEKRTGLLCCCAVLGLCLALLASWTEPLLDECRVTVLDVGQGQSILLQSEGRTYLVDCGGDRDDETSDIVAETLLSQGITRLDGVILTHYDRDHAGALGNLLTRLDTDLLLMPPDSEGASTALVQQAGEAAAYVTEDVYLCCGDTRITVYSAGFAADSNENSLCVLFQTENCDILITGDRSAAGERSLLRQGELPQLEVLVVGHHGSKYSTCEELLRQVKPEIAIISVGEDNSYGHPAQEVLDRLSQYGCRIYRTDLNGTVIYRR